MTLTNLGSRPDALLSVTTTAAGISQLHEERLADGVVSMRMLASLPLPPGEPVMLQPKGNHIMLMQLAHPLAAGEHIALELHFQSHAPEMASAIIAMSPPSP